MVTRLLSNCLSGKFNKKLNFIQVIYMTWYTNFIAAFICWSDMLKVLPHLSWFIPIIVNVKSKIISQN